MLKWVAMSLFVTRAHLRAQERQPRTTPLRFAAESCSAVRIASARSAGVPLTFCGADKRALATARTVLANGARIP